LPTNKVLTMNFKFIVAFFLLIGAISAVPTQHLSERTTTCSKKCLNHENNLFKEVGQTHHFTYETQSEIELENGQKTQVQLKAKVDVSTISKCEHQLHLRKVQISGPQEAELMKQQLERHSTKFSQDNGRIESVCFDENEVSWVANLKRAVLSTIQVSVREETEQIVEKDVLGYCNTKYDQISANTLQKTKYLNTCTKRSKSVTSILTGDFDKQKKSTCKIQLDSEKQLKSVVCEESNSMLPFAHSKAAGQISTQTKLTLDRIEKSLPEVSRQQMIRESLIFTRKQYNKIEGQQNLSEIRKAAEQILNEIRSDVQHNIQKSTPEKIKQLSQHLALLNVQELERLAQQVATKNDKVQDIFFDTVAQTGTQETAHIVLKVVLDRQFYKGEISQVRKAFWLSMLSNVEHVDEQILDIALEHIRRDDLPRQALFALTGMINEVKDKQEIKQDSRYQKVVSALIEKLNRANEEHEKIAILKALRNTGVHHESFDQILNIAKQSRHVETRIAAVQALEQHVTEERFFKKLMKIFENTSNESELRIAAFQVLINNQEKVHELYNVLKSESNKQVGSYVVSYFKNARESQIPEFETLRRITSTFDLPEKRFERTDFRQSKHIQFTQQSKKLDLSAQVEADLIFDEQKQLRNVRARFDLNKEKLQLKSVEVHVRQTGLPEVAQQVVQELTRQANLDKIVEEVQQITSIRSKHELNQKINRLVRLLNLDQINLSGRRFTDQVDASIHIRVQDKTVLYLNIREMQQYIHFVQQQSYNAREQLVDSLIGDNALTLILTNKQHRIPTAHGLPVHTGHSLVVVAALKNENGAFLPSIASDFHYEMGFTTMENRSKPAIHYHLQMHSAPGLKVNVERKNGLPSKVTVSIPEDRLELITVRSVVKLQKANGQEEELNVSKNQRKGCTRVFSKVLGAELCQQTVYPRTVIEKNAANALFNGPFEFTLQLKKTDSSIKHWEARFETPLHQSAGQSKALHVSFNTVGSNVNREVSAKIELQNDRDSKIVHIDLRTPVKKAKIEARAQWTQEHIGVKAALIMDSQRFEAELGGEVAYENGEQQYRPSIKLTIPGLRKIHYQGKVSLVNSGKKENFQIELRDAITNQLLIKASAIKSGKIDANENFKLATDLQAQLITGSSIRFVSNIGKNSNGVSSDLEVIHSTGRQAPTKYVWKFGLKDLSNGEVKKYNADWELNVPHTEFQNVAVSWNFVKKIDQEIESELTAFWSNRQGQKARQVHILQQLKRNKVSAKISSLWENLLKVEIVPLEVNYEIQAKTNWQRSQEKYNVQLTARDVKTNKQYRGEMSYQMPQENKFKINLEAKLNIENKIYKIVHNVEEAEKQQYNGRAYVELGNVQQLELNYVYKMKENSLQVPRLNHELDASIRIPSIDATFKHKSALKVNGNQFELRHSLRKNNAVVSDVKIALDKNGPSQLLLDSQLFQVKVEGDVSRSTKQINVLLSGKQHDLTHQTKLTWSGKHQIQIESKTTKSQRQLADVVVVYQKNQKAEAKIAIEKLGQLVARHQPNSQQWATVEISSDRFSRPIKQKFTIEKNGKKYIVRSKTHQNQQIVGEFDLELGSSSSLRVAAFDWKVTGSSVNKEKFNLVLENPKKNLREEVELQYTRKFAKVQIKHLNDKQRTSTLVAQVSTVDESKVEFDNEHTSVQIAVKPIGHQKQARLVVNDKKHNIHHKSELRYQQSTLIANVEHTQDNQQVVSHQSKLSLKDDSHTKTETKKFTVEAHYKRQSALEVKFAHQNGWKHSTNVEIVDARRQVARIVSTTLKNGEEILNVNVDLDGLKKVDVKVAHKQDKEIHLKVNLEDQQKHADLQMKYAHFEVNSKWSKESSQKHQKLAFEIVDKKHDAKYNLLAQHQRKTMLHIKIEGNHQQKSNLVELKLHRQGEAFFKIDYKNLKLKTELDFARSPVQATVTAECRKYQIKHETTITFLQQENELKIMSKTDKNSKQIANVDFRINPTTKQIFASGEVQNKNLKIEGNVNRRYSIELKSERDQFKHETELDLNTRTLRSETAKNGEQLYQINARISNRRDIEGTATVREHELTFRSNENTRTVELNYNNKKMNVRSTGQYTISRDLISAKINGQQRSRQIIDLDISLRANQRSTFGNQYAFEGKLAILESRSSVKIDLSDDKKQVRANVEYVNREKDHEVRFTVDTLNRDNKQVSAKIHTKNLKFEKEIRLVNGQELKIEGRVERNGEQLVKGNVRIEKPFKINGQVHLNTRSLKGQATLESLNRDEIKIEFSARDSQERKIADVKSKISKSYNKINVDLDFDSEKTKPFTFTSEWRKESDQLAVSGSMQSKGQKVGKLEGQIRFDGLTVDAKLEGDLTVNGKRKEIVYKLSNMSQKLQHVLKLKTENYSYGYDITVHLKQGHFIIHLPNRIVELRYDVQTQVNGHYIVVLDVLPNAEHQPNNIYNFRFDNSVQMAHQEFILNIKTTVHHPEIHHPIEMVFRGELREMHHNRPLVLFVSYDASANQQSRISGLFEITNESNLRVAHINISHQNTPIIDVHYRWAVHTYLVHQQLSWSIVNRNTQRTTGELLGQVDLKQRKAKIELNNKHKLQVNWESNFDKNTIVHIKAQTDNLVRKMKIVANNKNGQLEITNYENEKIVSNYVVSVLKEKSSLLAVEMHQKQGSKFEKVAFIQLVKDSLNYAKIHMKVEQRLVYQIQNSKDHLESKIRSFARRHAQEIRTVAKQQYQNLRLDEQTENTAKFIQKASDDLTQIAQDYLRVLHKYVPDALETVNAVYEQVAKHLSGVWNVRLEKRINQIVSVITEKLQKAERKLHQIKEAIEERSEKIAEQYRELKEKLNHDVVVKLSNHLEEVVRSAVRSSEKEGEQVYSFLHRNLKPMKLHKIVEKIRSIIVKIKDQVKYAKVHETLHSYIFEEQNAFEGKWNPRGGEIVAKVWYPTRLTSKRFYY